MSHANCEDKKKKSLIVTLDRKTKLPDMPPSLSDHSQVLPDSEVHERAKERERMRERGSQMEMKVRERKRKEKKNKRKIK